MTTAPMATLLIELVGATILFILKRFLDRHRALRADGRPGLTNGVAMAFGPGLTLEGALLRQVA